MIDHLYRTKKLNSMLVQTSETTKNLDLYRKRTLSVGFLDINSQSTYINLSLLIKNSVRLKPKALNKSELLISRI
jgi:hypothetical protein